MIRVCSHPHTQEENDRLVELITTQEEDVFLPLVGYPPPVLTHLLLSVGLDRDKVDKRNPQIIKAPCFN